MHEMSTSEAMPAVARRPAVPGGELLQLRPWILNRARRGFARGESDVQARLDAVVSSFASGYNHVMAPRVSQELSAIPVALRGFAVEGAAMGAVLGDLLTFSGGRRLRSLAAI